VSEEKRDEPLQRPTVGFNAAWCFTSLAKLVRAELVQERKEYARTFVVGLVAQLPAAPRGIGRHYPILRTAHARVRELLSFVVEIRPGIGSHRIDMGSRDRRILAEEAAGVPSFLCSGLHEPCSLQV